MCISPQASWWANEQCLPCMLQRKRESDINCRKFPDRCHEVARPMSTASNVPTLFEPIKNWSHERCAETAFLNLDAKRGSKKNGRFIDPGFLEKSGIWTHKTMKSRKKLAGGQQQLQSVGDTSHLLCRGRPASQEADRSEKQNEPKFRPGRLLETDSRSLLGKRLRKGVSPSGFGILKVIGAHLHESRDWPSVSMDSSTALSLLSSSLFVFNQESVPPPFRPATQGFADLDPKNW